MSYNRTRDAEDINPIEPREVTDSTTATASDGVIIVNGPSVVDPGFEADEFSAEFTNNTGDRLSNGTTTGATWGVTNEWTWMVWVKIDVNSTSRRILGWLPTPSGSLDSFELTWSGTGGFRGRIVDDSVASLDKIADFADDYNAGDGWAQVIVTWDGTLATSDQMKAWVNGVSQTLNYTSNDAGMNMGDRNRYVRFGNNTAAFGGQMHSAALWDVALDGAAVTTIFNGGNGANFNIGSDSGNYNESANCVAWWRFGKEGDSDPQLGQAAIDNTTSGTADVENDFGTVVRSTLFPGGGSGQVTVTLPEASTVPGKVVTVSDKFGAAATLPVIIGATASDTVNGETGENIGDARGSKSYVSDGVNTWRSVSVGVPEGSGGAGATGEQGPTGETGPPGGDTIVSTAVVRRDATNQTISNNSLTEVEWDTVGSDPDGWNDIGGSEPGRLTVPSGQGIDAVAISVQIEWAANATGRRIIVMRKNGLIPVDGGRQHLEYAQATDTGSTVQNVRFPRMAATAGDYFTIDVEQESGGNLDVQESPNTWFVAEGIVTGGVVNGTEGATGATGSTGPTGPTGNFDSTAALHTFGDNANGTTTLEVNSNTESRVVLANSGTDQWRIDNSGGGFRVTDVVNSQSPFRIQAGADGDAIHIDAEGDVGIKTIPEGGVDFHMLGNSAKFEAESGAMNLIVEGATGQAADLRFNQIGQTEWIWRLDGASNFVLKNSANQNIFGIINGVTTEAIRIDSAGEVGINNTTPQRQLDVDGTGRFSETLDIGDASQAQPALRFNRAGTDEWLVYSATGTGVFIIADIDNSTFPFRITKNAINGLLTLDDNGVGINELTPTRSLDVTGTGHFTDLLEADGGIDINGARVNSLGVTSTGVNLTVTTEDLVACTAGNITITLPAVASAGVGRQIVIKDRNGNAQSNNITIDGNAAEQIDGAATFVMNVDYQSVTVVNDGTAWMIV